MRPQTRDVREPFQRPDLHAARSARTLRLVLLACVALGIAGPAAPRALPKTIVMMWQVNGPAYQDDMRALARAGVNTLQSFPLARQTTAYADSYLAAAATVNLGVIPFIGADIKGSDGVCELAQQSVDFVRHYARHPAIVAWQTVDEPANHRVSAACQRRLYAQTKKLDPDHPVLVTINFTSQKEYDQYFAEDAFDLLDIHRYVNPHIGDAQEKLMALFRKNRTRSYPVIVTLRAFDSPSQARGWVDLEAGTLDEQYAFFSSADDFGGNIGFYGWALSPNIGIKQLPWLKKEFDSLLGRLLNKTAAN